MATRPIPDERDQINRPERPDLRCHEHEAYYDVLHGLLGRVINLEERMDTLECREARSDEAAR